MTIEDAKQIRISHFLSLIGYHPVKEGIKDAWYISPLRNENTASFHVFRDDTRWHDFGDGCGGDLIDLSKHLFNASCTREALLRIEEVAGNAYNRNFTPRKEKKSSRLISKEHDYQIQVTDLSMPLLLYSRSRGINDDTIIQNCKQVNYSTPEGYRFYGIGFLNDKGGWEIRSKKHKRCIGRKAPTSYLDLADTPTVVFEGFFDFLSAIELKWLQPASFNAVVLNSVSELKTALSFFSSRQPVISCLDNDRAGREAASQLMRSCNVVEDWSTRFTKFKDLNDFLVDHVTTAHRK